MHTGPDFTLTRISDQARFRVTLLPPPTTPVVNELHAWEIRLSSTDGKPIDGARIFIGGGMPEHGHGFPTRPQIGASATPGLYRIEGMKFNMPGWWEIRIAVIADDTSDMVTFNYLLPLPRADQR